MQVMEVQRNTILVGRFNSEIIKMHSLFFSSNFQNVLCCALLLMTQGNSEVFCAIICKSLLYAILRINKALLAFEIHQT